MATNKRVCAHLLFIMGITSLAWLPRALAMEKEEALPQEEPTTLVEGAEDLPEALEAIVKELKTEISEEEYAALKEEWEAEIQALKEDKDDEVYEKKHRKIAAKGIIGRLRKKITKELTEECVRFYANNEGLRDLLTTTDNALNLIEQGTSVLSEVSASCDEALNSEAAQAVIVSIAAGLESIREGITIFKATNEVLDEISVEHPQLKQVVQSLEIAYTIADTALKFTRQSITNLPMAVHYINISLTAIHNGVLKIHVPLESFITIMNKNEHLIHNNAKIKRAIKNKLPAKLPRKLKSKLSKVKTKKKKKTNKKVKKTTTVPN